MSEKNKKSSPPYATFSSFLSFIKKLQETGVPSRIDPSVFGNASGSITYSIIAALKSLKLILEDGTPAEYFGSFVSASDEDKKPMMRKILRMGYPSLFDGQIDLKMATAGQFDDHIRDQYDAKGSTIDKVAAFFIAAAKFAEEPISPHLEKRKPAYSSPSSKKSSKQRKKPDGDENANGGKEKVVEVIQPQKPLQYQLIDLMTEPDFPENIKAPIWELVQYLAARDAKKSTEDTGDDED